MGDSPETQTERLPEVGTGSDLVDLWYVGSGNFFGGWRAIIRRVASTFLTDFARLNKLVDLWVPGVIT